MGYFPCNSFDLNHYFKALTHFSYGTFNNLVYPIIQGLKLVTFVFRKNNRLKIVMLVVLSFIGQVLSAAPIPCNMNTISQSNVMDHSAHMMSEQNDDSVADPMSDCCSKSVNCSMSGCISLALTPVISHSEKKLSSENIISSIKLVLNQPLTSLYRPPILS